MSKQNTIQTIYDILRKNKDKDLNTLPEKDKLFINLAKNIAVSNKYKTLSIYSSREKILKRPKEKYQHFSKKARSYLVEGSEEVSFYPNGKMVPETLTHLPDDVNFRFSRKMLIDLWDYITYSNIIRKGKTIHCLELPLEVIYVWERKWHPKLKRISQEYWLEEKKDCVEVEGRKIYPKNTYNGINTFKIISESIY